VFETKKKVGRKNYLCPSCKNNNEQVALEYTERFVWRSNEPSVVTAELKCPVCNRVYTKKESR